MNSLSKFTRLHTYMYLTTKSSMKIFPQHTDFLLLLNIITDLR